MLELPEIQISQDSITNSVDTIIPYVVPEEESVLPYIRKSMDPTTKVTVIIISKQWNDLLLYLYITVIGAVCTGVWKYCMFWMSCDPFSSIL